MSLRETLKRKELQIQRELDELEAEEVGMYVCFYVLKYFQFVTARAYNKS